ncbi:calmodulin-like protein 12 [Centruroides sculpturatus]|uniref:calmodulin-like protein 12 n=1 Tax=Centruroides sculpturatus TaxID=218467 RepID=UPI000C6DB5F4|nr:calmodulin-like protein 12 [Centruroides sculpturatus]
MSFNLTEERFEYLENSKFSEDERNSSDVNNLENILESSPSRINHHNSMDSQAIVGGVKFKFTKRAESGDSEIESSEVRKKVICSLSSLIEMIGETLSSKDMDEIIQEFDHRDGNVDIQKLLLILEKLNEEDEQSSDDNRSSLDNVEELRRRMKCLGIITKILGKNITEEDLQDMLAEDLDFQEKSGTIDFARLLTLMEEKMTDFTSSDNSCGEIAELDKDKISLTEIHNVMISLGNVMINLGQNISDDEFWNMLKKETSGEDFDFPQLLVNTMEKEMIDRDDDSDIIKDFRVFDPRGTGYVYVDEIRKVMMNFGDKLSEEEMEEFLKDVEIDGRGQFNYVDFVTKITSKQKERL